MSKESPASLLNAMKQQKVTGVTRSGRATRPSTRYPDGGEGGGGGRGGGGEGGRVAPLLLGDKPSASGDVASGSTRSESTEAEVEMEAESRDEETEREMAPKRLRVRGEATVPEGRREPTTEDGKALIVPNDKE